MVHEPASSTPLSERRRTGLARASSWLLQRILLFLEIIGLRAPRPAVAHEAQVARFRLHHTAFRRLLGANDSFLRNMADLEHKIVGEESCDAVYLRETSIRMVADIYRMIQSLNEIASDRHQALWPSFEKVNASLVRIVDAPRSELPRGIVSDLSTIGARDAGSVGAKMANLGEIRNQVGLPTPDGFAVTVHAYRLFLEKSALSLQVEAAHPSLSTPEDADRLSDSLHARILEAEVPDEIRREVLAAYDRLANREGHAGEVAVRSSALGEDEHLSFAGQYDTVLNVDRDRAVSAWHRVVASLYSRSAMQYRLLHGLTGAQEAMAVGFVSMIPAIVSGIVFSRDPARDDDGQVIIQVVSGLGVRLVDGSTVPETIEVTLQASGATVEGVPQMEMEWESLLTNAEAEQLARWARRLESHFGGPQDIEWAMDEGRRLFLLQSRPLQIADATRDPRRPVEGARLLVGSGEVVCPGVGNGVAVHLDDTADFASFPEGGVLVVKRPSPRFVALMRKASAIVADAGSTTGHMASLAREFRIPTLLGTRDGTKRIPDGQVVTVDAFGGYVYAGQVDVPPPRAPHDRGRGGCRHDLKTRHWASRVAELVVPLRLTDPRAPDFAAENCTTLHDIARFVHEKSYEEMFRMGESLGDFRSSAYYLDVFLPIDLYIVDLGGGISGTVRGQRVKVNQIGSVPLRALLKGMLHPKIPRWGARPIDLGGFFSVVVQHALTSPEQERTFRDPCYALVSDRYVNYTARVGYHFSVVDSYCGDTANKNYVHLLFRGGAADLVRRCRRARAIAGILKEWGFSVEVAEDSTSGRISKMPREETARTIEHVGRLLQFMRQMDVAMNSEAAVLEVQEAFLREDYGLERQRTSRES